MPIYNENHGCFSFVSFMVVTFFLPHVIISASVVNEYRNGCEQCGKRKAGVDGQFESVQNSLDVHDTGRIDRETVMALF
jgi:hypothetical protein